MSDLEVKFEKVANECAEGDAGDRVKNRSSNEKAYANLVKAIRGLPGLSLRLHHLHDDRIIIDVEFTHNVKSKHPDECLQSVIEFGRFFEDSTIRYMLFSPAQKETEIDRFYHDVSDRTKDEIVELAGELRKRFSTS